MPIGLVPPERKLRRRFYPDRGTNGETGGRGGLIVTATSFALAPALA
jgi:hypothetical protein